MALVDGIAEKMFVIEIPPDSMFMLRFSGTVYHQFCPKTPGKDAFFAISVHTNEAGGLDGDLLEIVKAGNGSIPLLTEPISDEVATLLGSTDLKKLPVKDRQRRTVSATKRYVTRLRHGSEPQPGAVGAAPEPVIRVSHRLTYCSTLTGNHVTKPETISHEVATILAQQMEELKDRILHFSLPRLATIYSPSQDTYYIEFERDAPQAVEKALAATITIPSGDAIVLEPASPLASA